MATFELIPNDGRKSFCHKVQVADFGNGEAVLYSYGTPVIKRTSGAELIDENAFQALGGLTVAIQ